MRARPCPHPKRLLVLAALVTVLTFAACAPRGHQPGSGLAGGGPTNTQNVDTSGIQSTDQSLQSAIQALQSAQNDANTDYSSQDAQTVP